MSGAAMWDRPTPEHMLRGAFWPRQKRLDDSMHDKEDRGWKFAQVNQSLSTLAGVPHGKNVMLPRAV